MIDRDDIDLIHSQVPFDRLRGKRILLTGGSGFVGHWLSIVPDDVRVTALNHLQYDYGKWDLARWDYIIHLANVPPARVIRCAKECGAAVLYSSSGSVVTDREPGEYTRGKMAAENDLLNSGLDVKIARMYTFAGAYMKNHFALTNMIYDALSGGNIIIRAQTPRVTRSYMYAADMAVWLWRILLDGKKGGIYEVGSVQPVNMDQLARAIQKQFSPPPLIEHSPMYFNDPRPWYVPEISKALAELDLAIYTPFERAIEKTVRHYRAEMESVK